jgi:hypothetical protein
MLALHAATYMLLPLRVEIVIVPALLTWHFTSVELCAEHFVFIVLSQFALSISVC